jgi:hypothetical protein
LLRDSSKKSVLHYGFGEIINDRCTNITTRTLSRYLKTESRGTIALRLRTHSVTVTGQVGTYVRSQRKPT